RVRNVTGVQTCALPILQGVESAVVKRENRNNFKSRDCAHITFAVSSELHLQNACSSRRAAFASSQDGDSRRVGSTSGGQEQFHSNTSGDGVSSSFRRR